MAEPLRVLILEDVIADAELAERELRRAGVEFTSRRVETEADFLAGLEEFHPEVIISDYQLSGFDGMAALALVLKRAPQIPFIVTTGATNEETAVGCMKAGAWDYVLKDRLSRLPLAVSAALDLARTRRERERVETALREREEVYSAIVNQAAQGIILVDSDTMSFVEFNDAACRGLGYTREEFRSLTIPEIQAAQSPAEIAKWTEQLRRTGGGVLDTKHYRKDGTVREVRVSNRIVKIRGHEYISAIWEDITERKRAESELRRSEAQFRSYFELPLHGVALSSTEKRWLRVNDRLCSILGYSRDELLKMTWAQTTHPEDLEANVRLFNRVLSGAMDHYALEKRFVRKDGTIIWADLSVGCVRKADGGVDYLVVLVEDISEKKAAEHALRESEERYRLIAENTADVIWTLDLATRRFTYVSPSVERLRGFSAAEVMAQPFEATVTPESRGRIDAALAASLAALAAGDESARVTTVEVEQPTRGGGVVWTEVVASAIADASGRVTGILGVTRDIAERKCGDDALRESEERYRAFVDSTSDLAFVKDEELRYVLVNRANQEFFGRPEDEIVGKTDFDLMPRDAAEACRRSDEQALLEQAVIVTQERSGGRVYESRKFLLRLRNGEVGVGGFIRDVTDRELAAEELRRSEEEYRALFDGANDAIVVFEPGSETILDANPKACELYGYGRDELVGSSLKRLTLDVARGERLIADLFQDGNRNELETVHVRRDGTAVHLQIKGSVVDYGGKTAVLSIARDITQRRRDEAERKRLATAIEQSAEAVVITDTGGTIEYVNPAFEWITGYPAAEAVGRNPRVLKSGKQPPAFYAEMWAVISSGSVWTGKLTNRRKDGSVYQEEMSISPIRDQNGEIINFVAVKRDVTSEMDLQQQLAQAQKMEAVGRLAGGVAHDFNNILQALITHVQLMRGKPKDRKWMESSIQEMENLIGRGAALTRQLLIFSRRETVKPEHLDLNEQVREAGRMLQRLVKENIKLSIAPAPQRLQVTADRGQLDQVLMNLVVNAADAMPDGGQLTIRTGSADPDRVWLSVSDTGTGIPDEIRESIFEPFFTTKASGKGTGLGLSVVNGIVAQHGGTIEVESEMGRGTTFKVSLPEAGSGKFAALKEVWQHPAKLTEGRGERVLVVEDEEGARQGLHDILVSLGYAVASAGSGEEAGSLPADPRFDVLLTDLMLPGVTGTQLAAGLKARWPGLRVILMSGYTEDEAVRRDVGGGTVRFLQKPFDMATLAREVRAALDE